MMLCVRLQLYKRRRVSLAFCLHKSSQRTIPAAYGARSDVGKHSYRVRLFSEFNHEIADFAIVSQAGSVSLWFSAASCNGCGRPYRQVKQGRSLDLAEAQRGLAAERQKAECVSSI